MSSSTIHILCSTLKRHRYFSSDPDPFFKTGSADPDPVPIKWDRIRKTDFQLSFDYVNGNYGAAMECVKNQQLFADMCTTPGTPPPLAEIYRNVMFGSVFSS